MKYGLLAFFAFIWMGSAVITAAVELQADPSDATGSGASYEDFVNTTFATEELTGDRPITGGENVISASWSLAKSSVGWVGSMFNAAALNSPIWEGWATPIRYTILALQVPMLLLLAFEGAKVLSGFIPFT